MQSPVLAYQPSVLYPQPPSQPLPKTLLRLLNYDPETGLCHKGWNDLILALLVAACFLLVKTYLYKSVFPVLASRFSVFPGRMHRLKFSEQAWLLICHMISFVAGSLLLIGKDYGTALYGEREGQKHFWYGYPQTHRFLDPVFKVRNFECTIIYTFRHPHMLL